MKKTLLIICSLAINYISTAQTINSTNIVNVGDTIFMAIDIAPSVSLGTNSTGNNWNFSSLVVNSRDTTVFNSPSSSTGGNNFPSATLAFNREIEVSSIQVMGNTFLNNSTSSLELQGISNGTITAKHLDPETIITYPSSFGTTFTDTSVIIATVSGAQVGQTLADSIKIKSITYTSSDFNASGSLTTSFGVFQCIRQYLVRKTVDTIWAKSSLTGGVYTKLSDTKDTTYSHQYYSDMANTKFPLVTYDLNKDGTLSGDVNWMTAYSAGANNTGLNKIETKSVSVYPNPTNNLITVDIKEAIKSAVIKDISGKTVLILGNLKSNTLDVNTLKEGIYIITITTDSYVGTSKFIKQ